MTAVHITVAVDKAHDRLKLGKRQID